MKFLLLTLGFSLVVGASLIIIYCISTEIRKSVIKKPTKTKPNNEH